MILGRATAGSAYQEPGKLELHAVQIVTGPAFPAAVCQLIAADYSKTTYSEAWNTWRALDCPAAGVKVCCIGELQQQRCN